MMFLLAQGIFRKAFKTDVIDVLKRLPFATAQIPFQFEYTEAAAGRPDVTLQKKKLGF